jgi:hypothetical protein
VSCCEAGRNLFIKAEPQLTEVSWHLFYFLFFTVRLSSLNDVILTVGIPEILADRERSTSQISHLQN